MHLIATNVCEWLNVIIQETRDDIIAVAYNSPAFIRYTTIKDPVKSIVSDGSDVGGYISPNDKNTDDFVTENGTSLGESWICNITNIITPIIRSVNPYLRSCGVEYSLLCSIIIVVIWNDLCTVPGSVILMHLSFFFTLRFQDRYCLNITIYKFAPIIFFHAIMLNLFLKYLF